MIATGTRADWGLLLPLVKELDRRGTKPIIVATYAHLFENMGDTIQELVAEGYPPTMSVPARMEATEAVADTVTGFEKAFRFFKPDIVTILGDRFEMLGVATSALLNRVPVAHIAGGTVSEGAFDNAMRNAISQMATLHFPETEKGRRKLILMGADPINVVTVGALGVYNALNVPMMPLNELSQSIDFELETPYLLGTFHPATLDSLSPIQQMAEWLEGLDIALQRNPDLKILLTFPNTDSEPTALLSRMFTFSTKWRGRVKIVDSLGMKRYLSAARYASVVAGNSSSGIVEIPSVGTPVVNVGIRQKGRQRSSAVIDVELDAEKIADGIEEALRPETRERMESTPNPYYKPDTPTLIADALLSYPY